MGNPRSGLVVSTSGFQTIQVSLLSQEITDPIHAESALGNLNVLTHACIQTEEQTN